MSRQRRRIASKPVDVMFNNKLRKRSGNKTT